MNRNRILSSGNHRFVLLLEEAVLRYRIGGADVMATQLACLARAAALPSVALGVIPFAAPERTAWPVEQFTVFDDERVHVELLSAHVTVTAPSKITLHIRAFERLARLSVYGDAAHALIADAIRALGYGSIDGRQFRGGASACLTKMSYATPVRHRSRDYDTRHENLQKTS